MGKHVGVVAILMKGDRKRNAPKVNDILTKYGNIVVGRMGIPYVKRDIHVITLIVDGTNGNISEMTKKLSKIKGVAAESTLTSCN